MATEDETLASRRGAGTAQARVGARQLVTLTVNGNTTLKGQITIPANSWFRGITLDTPVAITGTPTHSNFRAGLTDGGQDFVADVDAKAAGHIACTVVAALDKANVTAGADTVIFYQLTTAGGTASAGPVEVFADYDPPVY